MLKNIVKLEYKIEEKVYQLLLDNDSPLEHIKEVLFQFQKFIGHLEDNAKAQAEAQSQAALENAKSKVEPIQEAVNDGN